MPGPVPPTQAAGLVLIVASYTLWGLLPLYFLTLEPSGPFEIVAWRVVLSLLFCVLLLALTRGWVPLLGALRDRRAMLLLGAAGSFIMVSWPTYIFAALSGQVVEAALGYFLTPIITVLLGVLVLRERLRPAQWVSITVSAIAALVLAVGYGRVPFIAIVLAVAFGLYSLMKQQVGRHVDPVVGLTIETAWLAPLTIAVLAVLAATTGLTLGGHGTTHTTLLLAVGVVTVLPLLLFASAARRLPLTLIGLTQYISPIVQFLIGVLILREPMPVERWVGFALVWVALIVLTMDLYWGRRLPRSRRTAEPP